MRRLKWIVLCLLLVTLLFACAKEEQPENFVVETAPPTESQVTTAVETSASAAETTQGAEDAALESKMNGESYIFDFAEMPIDKLPSGIKTMKQLDALLGKHKSVIGQYIGDFDIVLARAKYKSMGVFFYFEDPKKFSFYSSKMDSGKDYSFAAKDMDLKLEVVSLYIQDPAIKLPRGIKIGTTTEAELLAKYPKGSEHRLEMEEDNVIMFNYEFRDKNGKFGEKGGSISYNFNADGLLAGADIAWRYVEL